MLVMFDVPEDRYPAVLDAVAAILRDGSASGVIDDDRVLEAGIAKRPYVGAGGIDDAVAALRSLGNPDAHRLVRRFVEDRQLRGTRDEVAAMLGVSPGTANSARMLLGRAAYSYGQRVNPISADKRAGEDVARWFMRDETREVYAQALALLDEAATET